MKAVSSDTVCNSVTTICNKRKNDLNLLLSQMDYDIQDIIMSYIANLCNVRVSDMLSSCDNVTIAQVRWLVWYALRQIYNDTYEKIAQRTSLDGCTFTSFAVGKGIAKMTFLINSVPQWGYRWRLVDKVIKRYKEEIN